jgi:MFS family permease
MRRFAGETFSSLEIRNFRLFFGGQFVSQVGNWLTLVAQSLLVYNIAHTGTAVGLLVACQFLPTLVIGPWAGLVADRSDKRKLLLIVQAGAMLQSFGLAVIGFMHQPHAGAMNHRDHVMLGALFAVAAAGGLANAFDNPARRSFVIELVPETHVQNAVSLNSAMMTSSRIFGPALAGLLIATAGYGWCFLLDGLSYITVLVALYLLDPSAVRAGPVATKGRGQVRAGLRYIRATPVLWISLGMTALIGTLTFNFAVVFPVFVKHDLGGNDWQFTLLFSATSVGSMIAALLTARRTSVQLRDIAYAAMAFGVAMAALAAAPNLAWAYAIGILAGAGSITFMTTSTTIVQLRADPVMRGRVLAIQAMVFLGSTPIGGPILGRICDAFGGRAGVLVGAVAAVVAGMGGWVLDRRYTLQRSFELDDEIVTAGADLVAT